MICPEELTILITAASISLSKGRDEYEIAVLSAVFTQLGDSLATILAQRAYINACCDCLDKKEENKFSVETENEL